MRSGSGSEGGGVNGISLSTTTTTDASTMIQLSTGRSSMGRMWALSLSPAYLMILCGLTCLR